MVRLIYTGKSLGKAKTHEGLKAKTNEYEQDLSRFNKKHVPADGDTPIKEDVQVMAVKLMMPDEMLTRSKAEMPEMMRPLKENVFKYVNDCRSTTTMERNGKATTNHLNQMTDTWDKGWQ